MNYVYFILLIVILLILISISMMYYNIHSMVERKKKTRQKRLMIEPLIVQKRKKQEVIAENHPPEIIKMQKLLNDFTQSQGKWDCIVAMGDIYRNGAFPRFLPNEDLGIKCYQVAAQCPNGDVAGMAQIKFIQARMDPIDNIDKRGNPFPIKYGMKICDLAFQRIRSIPMNMFEKPKQKKLEVRPIASILPFTATTTTFQTNNNLIAPTATINNRLIAPFLRDETQDTIVPNPEYRADTQNVHDHAVITTAKHNFDKIRNIKVDGNRDTKKELKRFIIENDEMTDEEVSNAIELVNNLSATEVHSKMGASEMQVLEKVWSKIQSETDDVKRNNMAETLSKQLATGIENGKPVCSTGKITRILSVFDGSDVAEMETAKPLWAVKEEIANTAANIRKRNMDTLSEQEIIEYNSGNLNELDERMKSEFRKEVEETYLTKLGMNKSIIQPIIEMYQEAF